MTGACEAGRSPTAYGKHSHTQSILDLFTRRSRANCGIGPARTTTCLSLSFFPIFNILHPKHTTAIYLLYLRASPIHLLKHSYLTTQSWGFGVLGFWGFGVFFLVYVDFFFIFIYGYIVISLFIHLHIVLI